jgi:HTH-type transcriptional regulator / antitoxin HipB
MAFFLTPLDLQRSLGARLREARLVRGLTIETVAVRSGVAVPTIQRFETSGRGTMTTFTRLIDALDLAVELQAFLAPPVLADVDAVLAEERGQRRRGRRRMTT